MLYVEILGMFAFAADFASFCPLRGCSLVILTLCLLGDGRPMVSLGIDSSRVGKPLEDADNTELAAFCIVMMRVQQAIIQRNA